MASSMCRNVRLFWRCFQRGFDESVTKVAHFCTKPVVIGKAATSAELESKNAKGTLHNILQVVAREFKNPNLLPKIVFRKVCGISKASHNWEATVSLLWPEPITTTYTASNKATAQRVACWQALQIMMKLDMLTKDFRPCLIDKDQLLTLRRQQKAPKFLSLSYQVELRMRNFIKDYKDLRRTMSDLIAIKNEVDIDRRPQSPLIDVVTGRPLSSFGAFQASLRNTQLLRHLTTRPNLTKSNAVGIHEMQASLPIHDFKDHILSSIELHPVVIVSGETGCGKTTQLPQYILDHYVLEENGSSCNIVVTQPRRLAAISVAKRVADECSQQLGDSVGYQVRLSSVMPQDKGAILYCTGGILLQRLINNPTLEGVSHVVLDEAHERSVATDFLLVLLKDLIKERPLLRVIVMSASMNVEKLSSFFDDCPIIKVPGFTHPISDHFLPDILNMMGQEGQCNATEETLDPNFPPPVSYDFVAEVIYWIDHHRPPGGILCFLPGWQDINAVYNCLKKITLERGWEGKHAIIPVHSLVPLDRQASIFETFSNDERKIVLATNIAETSITVPDISYVMDSGRCKDLYFDSKWGTSSLQTQWVSKANVQQRRGRAGRTHPGECFHLYPREVLDDMEPFPIPEMRRISLEKVILDAELYCKNNAESFLACCPDPPHPDMVTLAQKDLFERGFLTSDMKLTALGHCATRFPCHPYVTKAVMYGRWMRCLDPVLTVAAYLSADSKLFRTMPDEHSMISAIKMSFASGIHSDHWSIYRIFEEWEKASRKGIHKINEFCEEYVLSKNALKFLKGLKHNLFANLQHLKSTDVLSAEAGDHLHLHNQYSKNPLMVSGALAAGFSPNFLLRITGSANKSKIVKDEIWLKNSKRIKTHLQRDSVNYKVPPEWMTYLHIMQSGVARYTTVRETSAVSPFAVAVFAGQHLVRREVQKSEEGLFDAEDPVVLGIDNNEVLSFYCSRSVAELLCEFRYCVSTCFQYSMCGGKHARDLSTERISDCEAEALAILSELFQSTSETGAQKLNNFLDDARTICVN